MADTCALCTQPKAPGSAYFCEKHRAAMRPPAAPAPAKPRTPSKGAYVVVAVVLLGVIVGVAVAVARSGAKGNTSGTGGGGGGAGADHPAQMLADLDGASDAGPYVIALDAWAADCTGSRYHAASLAYGTYKAEGGHGPDGSILETMRHLTASVPADVAPTNCRDIGAAYLTLANG